MGPNKMEGYTAFVYDGKIICSVDVAKKICFSLCGKKPAKPWARTRLGWKPNKQRKKRTWIEKAFPILKDVSMPIVIDKNFNEIMGAIFNDRNN